MGGNSTEWATFGGSRYAAPPSPIEAAFAEAFAEVETAWTDPARRFFLTLPLQVVLAMLVMSVAVVDALQVIAVMGSIVEATARGANRVTGFFLRRATMWVRNLTEMAWSTFKLVLIIGGGPSALKLGYNINAHAYGRIVKLSEPFRQAAYEQAYAIEQALAEFGNYAAGLAQEVPSSEVIQASLIQTLNAFADAVFIMTSTTTSAFSAISLESVPSLRFSWIPKTAHEDDILRIVKVVLGTLLLGISTKRLASHWRSPANVEQELAIEIEGAHEEIPNVLEGEEDAVSVKEVAIPEEFDASEIPELESPISTSSAKESPIYTPSVRGSPYPLGKYTPISVARGTESTMSPAKFKTPISATRREAAPVTPFIAPLDASQESNSTNESFSFSRAASSENKSVREGEDENASTENSSVMEPSIIDLSLEDSDEEKQANDKGGKRDTDAENTVSNVFPRVKPENVRLGLQVTVLPESRPGLKRRNGGVGKIVEIHADGTVTVKYAVERGKVVVDLSNLLLGAHPTAYGVRLSSSSESSNILSKPAGETVASRRLRLLDTSNKQPVAPSPGMKPVYRVQRGPVTRTSLRRMASTGNE